MIASVGVCTRPSETAPSNELRSRIVAARVAFMPTIQSASERERAACSSFANSAAGRSSLNASFIAAFVIEFSHSLCTGFFAFAFSYRYAKISSPSRPASQALTTSSTSSRPSCLVTTDICLRERSSRTSSLKRSGTIGRSAMRQLLYLASYASGSASCTRCPTAHVTTCSGPSRNPSCFLNGPGSTRARSCPTEGFSATSSVLDIAVSVAGSAAGALSGAHPGAFALMLVGFPQHARDRFVGHPVAAVHAAVDGRREHRRQHLAVDVHQRAAGVARPHQAAQRR